MPNHVTNLVQFACSRDRFMEIAETVCQDGEFLGSVDFGKLIPMPESLNIECGSRGQQGLKEYREYLKAVDRHQHLWQNPRSQRKLFHQLAVGRTRAYDTG